MSRSRLLSVGAWRSLLQAVSMPASWTPACSEVQAHSVLRALCSVATEHAPLKSRSASSRVPPAEPARHDAHGCSQITHDAREARPDARAACIWTNCRPGGLAIATPRQHSHSVRTVASTITQRRPLSSGAAADKDTSPADESSAVEVTAASTHAAVPALPEPLLKLLAVIVLVVNTTGCMCSDITCSKLCGHSQGGLDCVRHCTAGRKRHR